MNYEVYLVQYLGQPRNHHALLVCTNGSAGRLFHVKGSILKGMTYEVKETKDPQQSATFDGRKQIGWVSSSDLGRFDAICRANPPPETMPRMDR
ncbi:hypothetical protein F4825DRAFT_435579 [Nemania diffusa]|nr:hypothetical protein F4825DRAFT_435579 [Nemania diffusa]